MNREENATPMHVCLSRRYLVEKLAVSLLFLWFHSALSNGKDDRCDRRGKWERPTGCDRAIHSPDIAAC